jgi:4-amino-4-deoxy-L-arabinose transferase-like glycosyltransferase
LIVCAVALVYAWLIYKHGSPFAAGSDSSGYLNSARLLAAGQCTVEPRAIPGYPPPWSYYSHMPLGFGMYRESLMSPTYPIGLPLHLVAFAPVVGWEKTARVVNAVNVLAAAVLLYALGRRLGLGRGWALAGIAALWLSPLWIMFALQPMSDPVAVTWTLATILCAWKSREGWGWSVLAGAALGMAVLVRPANAILAPVVLIALGLDWRTWLGCGVGGLPFAMVQLGYNVRAYGEALTTGYGFVGDAFEWANVPHNLAHFALWLPLLASVPIGLAALALPWLRKRGASIEARTPWLLGTWVLCFVAFYASYYFAGETWWYVRFLLPAFPALIMAGLIVVQHVAKAGGRMRAIVVAVVVAGFMGEHVLASGGIFEPVRGSMRICRRMRSWRRASSAVRSITTRRFRCYGGINYRARRWRRFYRSW